LPAKTPKQIEEQIQQALLACNAHTAKLWIWMRDVMERESNRKGYLHLDGHPCTNGQIADEFGCPTAKAHLRLKRLITAKLIAKGPDGYFSPPLLAIAKYRAALAERQKRHREGVTGALCNTQKGVTRVLPGRDMGVTVPPEVSSPPKTPSSSSPPSATATPARKSTSEDDANKLLRETGLASFCGPLQKAEVVELVERFGFDASLDAVRKAFASNRGGFKAIRWAETRLTERSKGNGAARRNGAPEPAPLDAVRRHGV
jgi:hypothetical protein